MKTLFERLSNEFSEIEKMPYGSTEQHLAADNWYKIFLSFMDDNENEFDDFWAYVHNSDVGYKARQRFIN